jgi:hypothetical protein
MKDQAIFARAFDHRYSDAEVPDESARTPELDNAHPGNGAVSLTSDVRYSAWFPTKTMGKGCAVISDKISKP